MRKRIGLVADMGESFGNYVIGRPEETMKLITTAMVACGYHAGDPMVMHQTVRWCKQYNVVLGAHTGFPDLLGFGRRYMAITAEEARDYIIYQVGALKSFADYVGIRIRAANTHGAFYRWAIESEEHFQAVLDGFKAIGPDLEAVYLPFPPGSPFPDLVRNAGLRVVSLLFPGLVYKADGTIVVARTYSADPDAMAKLVLKWLKTGLVENEEGRNAEVEADTILVHGDMPNCPEILAAMREVLENEGVEIRAVLE